MNTDTELILEQANMLYGVELVSEITMGHSGNRIFAVRKGENPSILRVFAYSPEGEAHIEFELKWMGYLADNMAEISGSPNLNGPVSSMRGVMIL